MAELLLRAWRAPSIVSPVDIDGSTGTLMKAENTTIDSAIGLKEGHPGVATTECLNGDDHPGRPCSASAALEWTQTDQALPMPLETGDETISMALLHSDFMNALNREVMTVSGLRAGRYSLQIDGEIVSVIADVNLAKGFNLAAKKTPMSVQAQTVLDLTYRRNDLRFARMMMVDNALKGHRPTTLPAGVEALESLEREVLSLQRAAALPKPHRYRLEALPGEPRSASAQLSTIHQSLIHFDERRCERLDISRSRE